MHSSPKSEISCGVLYDAQQDSVVDSYLVVASLSAEISASVLGGQWRFEKVESKCVQGQVVGDIVQLYKTYKTFDVSLFAVGL